MPEMRLIDANALKDRMGKAHFRGYGDAVMLVMDAPTVDAAMLVHGRWEEWWPGVALILTGEEMLYRCSACDAKYADIDGDKYCRNCGAKMDGGG